MPRRLFVPVSKRMNNYHPIPLKIHGNHWMEARRAWKCGMWARGGTLNFPHWKRAKRGLGTLESGFPMPHSYRIKMCVRWKEREDRRSIPGIKQVDSALIGFWCGEEMSRSKGEGIPNRKSKIRGIIAVKEKSAE